MCHKSKLYEGWFVYNSNKNICSKIKAHTKFYMIQQLPVFMGLCPNARISTGLIQGLQLVLCGTRLPLYPRSFLKPNHS